MQWKIKFYGKVVSVSQTKCAILQLDHESERNWQL